MIADGPAKPFLDQPDVGLRHSRGDRVEWKDADSPTTWD